MPAKSSQMLVDQPTFDDGSEAVCTAGHWILANCAADRLWCDKSSVKRGCETDATRLRSCRACSTQCVFSCGQLGCDETQKLAVGAYHSCALTDEGHVACWGRGADGRLGDDSSTGSLSPKPVDLLQDVADLAAGADHTCAIVGTDRTLYCWGSNAAGQLGTPEGGTSSPVPVAVQGLDSPRMTGVQQVATGYQHTCAILVDGSLLCWGLTLSTGVIDQGAEFAQEITDTNHLTVSDAKRVAVGFRHACIITDKGSVECWGSNSYGELAAGSAVEQSEKVLPVAGISGASAIVAGHHHTCALVSGRVFCWGLNGKLQLGRPSDANDGVPKVVPGLTDVVTIAAGDEFTCATTSAGKALCWGSNNSGERGDSDTVPKAEPTTLPLSSVIEVAAGHHACARTQEHHLYCWGSNYYGELGAGTRAEGSQPEPQPVKELLGSKL
jgi:alpha-tubulin suppressor-like RCC1 family protein